VSHQLGQGQVDGAAAAGLQVPGHDRKGVLPGRAGRQVGQAEEGADDDVEQPAQRQGGHVAHAEPDPFGDRRRQAGALGLGLRQHGGGEVDPLHREAPFG
jgi:hypothetical protein